MSFPELPYDVVESILIHAASRASTALTLCLVASWVRNIAVPHLFHTVVLDSYEKHLSFLENLRLARPQPSYGTAAPATIPLGQHLRHLYVDSSGADMHAMYAQCPRLESLALPASRLIAFATSAPRVFPRLRSLTVLTHGPSSVAPALYANPERVRPFAGISHLQFRALPTNPLPFEGMPLLTHLAQPLAAPGVLPHEFDDLLARCAALEMLVLTASVQPEPDTACRLLAVVFRAHEKRMYVVPRTASSPAEWRREVDHGGTSVWERAARFRLDLSL
ncbi:hypothetical protein B0H15DRAFT_417778 [Mycena belliarum]|uniref:F-box domain-containing protein n=1 Tax=Mycena belliarum TaxID=1033014 RepID=A0AAD6U3L5_9AGAR|nr:hypothetical protein B0H15DRAFT_417778 [Mycena belliae]